MAIEDYIPGLLQGAAGSPQAQPGQGEDLTRKLLDMLLNPGQTEVPQAQPLSLNERLMGGTADALMNASRAFAPAVPPGSNIASLLQRRELAANRGATAARQTQRQKQFGVMGALREEGRRLTTEASVEQAGLNRQQRREDAELDRNLRIRLSEGENAVRLATAAMRAEGGQGFSTKGITDLRESLGELDQLIHGSKINGVPGLKDRIAAGEITAIEAAQELRRNVENGIWDTEEQTTAAQGQLKRKMLAGMLPLIEAEIDQMTGGQWRPTDAVIRSLALGDPEAERLLARMAQRFATEQGGTFAFPEEPAEREERELEIGKRQITSGAGKL